MRPTVLLVALAVLSGCVSYDFTPVAPVTIVVSGEPLPRYGKAPLPNLMLAVDKSGSMAFDLNAEAPCAVPGCTTRWDELQRAMDAFLTSSGTSAHLGMVPFPADNTCGGATVAGLTAQGVHLDLSAEEDVASRAATAGAIRAALSRIAPGGGTPTGATLSALTGYAELTTTTLRAGYVLLLTDGLPNCNPDFASSSLDCFCTNTQALQPASTCGAPTANQCLDEGGAVAAIQALRARDVKTIVVGFGPTTSAGAGPATLSAMALAGGFERPCTADADCGAGDTCSVSTTSPCGQPMQACAQRAFQASNAADLGRVLDAVRDSVVCDNPCLVPLASRPETEAWVSVRVSGKAVLRSVNTWRYLPVPNQVEFLAAMCDSIRTATAERPVTIEVRVGERL